MQMKSTDCGHKIYIGVEWFESSNNMEALGHDVAAIALAKDFCMTCMRYRSLPMSNITSQGLLLEKVKTIPWVFES